MPAPYCHVQPAAHEPYTYMHSRITINVAQYKTINLKKKTQT